MFNNRGGCNCINKKYKTKNSEQVINFRILNGDNTNQQQHRNNNLQPTQQQQHQYNKNKKNVLEQK